MSSFYFKSQSLFNYLSRKYPIMSFKMVLIAVFIVMMNSKLIYISELFRHGARYPTSNMYDGNQTAPFHGQLTNIGLRQQYLLGNYLRADYIEKQAFLNKTLNPREVEVFTDEGSVDRCVYSAQAHLLGLYPSGSGYTLPPNLDPSFLNPPFVTNTSPNSNDDFALNLGHMPIPIFQSTSFFPKCPNENKILTKRGEAIAQIVSQLQLENAAFTQKMRLVFKLKPQQANVAGLAQLFDVVTCDMYLGRQIPQQFTKQDYVQLKYIQNYLFMLVYEEEPGNVFSTPLMSHVISNMKHVIDNTEKGVDSKKMSIYSGHDTNVVPLLSFLNLTSHDCIKKQWKNQTVVGNCAQVPPFASNVIFQLHQDSMNNNLIQQSSAGTYSVRIRYNGKYYNLCERTSTSCPFTEFQSRIKNRLVDFNKICGVTLENDLQQI